MSEKITPKTFPKFTPNPLSVGMPAYLKDPKNYKKIQKALLETLSGKHTHSEMQSWASCVTCQKKARDLKEMMKGIGFRNFNQYLYWKKTMDIIINKKRDPIR